MNIVDTAKALAQSYHAGQRRITGPDTDAAYLCTEPYVAHCERVAEVIEAQGHSPEVIAAAWLHDVLEDTECTPQTIAAECGPVVLAYVLQLTDHYTPAAYPERNRAWRKRQEAHRLALCCPEVRAIKRADIADNDAWIEAKGGDFAEVWRAEKAYLLGALRAADRPTP